MHMNRRVAEHLPPDSSGVHCRTECEQCSGSTSPSASTRPQEASSNFKASACRIQPKIAFRKLWGLFWYPGVLPGALVPLWVASWCFFGMVRNLWLHCGTFAYMFAPWGTFLCLFRTFGDLWAPVWHPWAPFWRPWDCMLRSFWHFGAWSRIL